MKKTLSILGTNWIHILGFYITTYVSLILFKLIGVEENQDEWRELLLISPFTIILLFFVYGLMIIGGFYGSILLLDVIGFSIFRNKVTTVLFIEWILIILPFVQWAFDYEYWLWLTLSLSFLVTQWIRKQKIEKILKNVA